MSEKHLNIEQQIDLVKSWRLQPDFVINIKVVLFIHFFAFAELVLRQICICSLRIIYVLPAIGC